MVELTEYLPEMGIDVSMLTSLITLFVGFFIVLIAAILIFFFVFRWMKYKYKVVVFEKVAGKFEPTQRMRAMIVTIKETGDEIFYVGRKKKYLPMPTIQTGRRVYWYAIREDKEWINIGIEDIDAKAREMKAHFLDKEMRYARAALQKNLKDRYQELGFWTKYGGLIAYVGLIAITGIMVWLLFDKFIELSSSVNGAVAVAKEVLAETARILEVVDNVKSSSGIVSG